MARPIGCCQRSAWGWSLRQPASGGASRRLPIAPRRDGEEISACSVGEQLTKEEIGHEAIAHLAKHYNDYGQSHYGGHPAGFDGLVERLKLVASLRHNDKWTDAWLDEQSATSMASKRKAEEDAGDAGEGGESKRVKDALDE